MPAEFVLLMRHLETFNNAVARRALPLHKQFKIPYTLN